MALEAERPRLVRLCTSWLGDPVAAEDAVQETLLEAWRKLDSLRDPQAFRGWLSGIAPTVEVHVTTPLNHRGLLSFSDPAGTPDIVNLSYGINFEFNERTRLAVGLANPITGPRPFDTEVMAHLRATGLIP